MIVRIYTGNDGQTHFEDLSLPAEESHNVAVQAGANLVFRRFPADYSSDWHNALRRQYIFILAGGRWKSGSATAPRAGLDRVMSPRRRSRRPGPYDALGGSSADQRHCAGGRLRRVLPSSTYEDTYSTSAVVLF